MKVVMGNREKKVIGAILTILFLAGLHFMVFSRKAMDYDLTMTEWRQAKDDVEKIVGQAKNPNEVKKTEERINKNKEEFNNIIRNLHIDLPNIYIDVSPESLKKRRTEFDASIERLLSFQTKLKNTKLSFLGEKGWNLPQGLPDNIRKRPERLWDVMSQLRGINAILKVIDNQVVRDEKLRQYGELLKEIGIDELAIDSLSKYGKSVPVITRICHYRLIIKEKPKDLKMTDEQIQEYLRIEYPDNFLHGLNRQLFALTDIIGMADANKIEDITEVQMNDQHLIREIPRPGETPPPGEAPVSSIGPPDVLPGGAPTAPAGVVEPELGLGAPAALRGQGYPMGGVEMGEPPLMRIGATMSRPTLVRSQETSLQNLIAVGMPLIIRVNGSNFNITNFLYTVCNAPKSYELDSLIINTIKEREGVLDAYAWVNVLASVEGVVVDLDTIWKEPKKEEAKPAAPGPAVPAPVPGVVPPAAGAPSGAGVPPAAVPPAAATPPAAVAVRPGV